MDEHQSGVKLEEALEAKKNLMQKRRKYLRRRKRTPV